MHAVIGVVICLERDPDSPNRPKTRHQADVEADHRPGIWRCYGFP